MVRNSRKQFLRLQLPKGSTVWSVFVNGQPEKPALAGEEATARDGFDTALLIKIINDAKGFPVELIYQTPINPMESMGRLGGMLAKPDMTVTNSRWEIYVPEEFHYHDPDTNMKIVEAHAVVAREEMEKEMTMTKARKGSSKVTAPFRIQVPTTGKSFIFEKLYANQSKDDAHFSLFYVDASYVHIGRMVLIAAALLFWAGVVAFFLIPGISSKFCICSIMMGGVGAFLLTTYLELQPYPVVIISGLAIFLIVVVQGKKMTAKR